MFRYILIGLIAYWVIKRIARVVGAIQKDGPDKPNNTTTRRKAPGQSNIDHSKGGEYVDYEEIE